MRPTALRVEGLHCFREPAVVDFEHLGAYGLFGVFGPTGAGKSTLLDALTLALYGEIDRVAGRGRDGIVHPGCDRVDVQLSFTHGEECYHAHRRFRRTRDGVETEIARLVRGGCEVIAENAREMTAEIVLLLGLSCDDFTRAVVLPQGKFAAFLALKPVARREMLQRLFRLGALGKGLRQGIGGRLAARREELGAIDAELRGLGNPTEQDVHRARAELEASRAHHAETSARLAEARGLVARWERTKEDTDELVSLQTQWADHVLEETRIEALASALDRCRSARALLPRLGVFEDAVDAERRADAEHRAAVGEEDRARARWESAAQAHAEAEGLAGLEEQWVSRQRRLEDALPALRSIRGLERDLEESIPKLEALEATERSAAEAIASLTARCTAIRTERNGCARHAARTAVPPDERTRVEAALRAHDAYVLAQKRAAATEAAWRERERASSRAEAALADAEAGLASATAAHRSAGAQFLRRRLGEAETAHASATNAHARALERHSLTLRALDDARLREHAAALARTLVRGERCPVCGATEHPRPAEAAENHHLAAPTQGDPNRDADDDAERTLAAVRRAERALAAAETRLEAARTAFERVLGTEVATAVDAPTIESDALATEAEVASLAASVEAARAARESAAGTHAAAVAAALAFRESWESARQERDGALVALDRARGDTPLLDVPSLRHSVERRDRDVREALGRVERHDADATRLETEIAALRTAAENARSQIEPLRNRIAAAQATAEALRTQCVADVADPDAALADATRQAAAIRLRRAKADEDLRASAHALSHATSRAGAAETAVRSQRAAREASETALRSALHASGFDTVEELSQSARIGTDVDADARRVTEWRARREALEIQIERARRRLHDATYDEGAHGRARAAFGELEQAHETAATALGASERGCSDLVARIARVRELRERGTQLAADRDRLEILQDLVRGDRMVDWLARDHLHALCHRATLHLERLTQGRYALHVDAEGGFEIADAEAAGSRRPTWTLSGGETFLASLALALGLSEQIQVHARHPLTFFFLDEGFGMLDPDALDRVLTAIEGLHEHRTIGLISHVPSVPERVPRYLEVRPGGTQGSRVRVVDH